MSDECLALECWRSAARIKQFKIHQRYPPGLRKLRGSAVLPTFLTPLPVTSLPAQEVATYGAVCLTNKNYPSSRGTNRVIALVRLQVTLNISKANVLKAIDSSILKTTSLLEV